MFMFLQKNKKGFTLIELMVVVAIIGILALLGLRLYSGQQIKAKEAIVKANAGTIQTLIQAELADKTPTQIGASGITDIFKASGIRNPFDNALQVANGATTTKGSVIVTAPGDDTGAYTIDGQGDANLVFGTGKELTARR